MCLNHKTIFVLTNPLETLNHSGFLGILVSAYYLGHTNSNLGYYLGWIVCEMGHIDSMSPNNAL